MVRRAVDGAMGQRVLLLRGVNLGARNKVPMARLRALLAAEGFGGVRTYVQSGNVLVDDDGSPPEAVGECVASLVRQHFGVVSPCLVRSASELRATVAAAERPDAPTVPEDPRLYTVVFLAAVPDASRVGTVDPAAYDEQFLVAGRGRPRRDAGRHAGVAAVARVLGEAPAAHRDGAELADRHHAGGAGLALTTAAGARQPRLAERVRPVSLHGMRFVVLGIGAVGGTVAARLVAAGEDVLALARGEHARVVREDGLRLGTPDGPLHVRLPVVEDPSRLQLHDDDVLVLAVKGQHTAALLEQLPLRAADLPVLCLQNGVANERAALRRHATVHGVSVALPALHTEPGQVTVFIRPSAVLDVGRYPAGSDDVDRGVAARWTAAGLVTRVREDVMAWKHRKLLSNLGNAVEALTGTGVRGEQRDAVRELHRLVLAEGEEVLRAAGRPVVDEDTWRTEVATAWELADVPGVTRGGGSTWQSLLRGAGSVEADLLNGEVVLAARELGGVAPVNELLRREVVDAASHRLPPGSVPATELLARVRALA